MQKIFKTCKGFTLAELAVALSVGAIVLAMLSLSVFYLLKAFTNSDYTNNSLAEYKALKTQVNEISQKWIEEGGTIQIQDGKTITCVISSNNVHSLQYDNNTLYLDEKKVASFQYISLLSFESQNNQLIVKVVFSGEEEIQFII